MLHPFPLLSLKRWGEAPAVPPRRPANKNTSSPTPQPMPGGQPTAAAALRLLAQLDDGERQQLRGEIISNPAAPLHDDLDMLLKECLHAMKSAVRAFVLFRDRASKGDRLWAANLLRQLKERNGRGWT